jgi:hypothetical protein
MTATIITKKEDGSGTKAFPVVNILSLLALLKRALLLRLSQRRQMRWLEGPWHVNRARAGMGELSLGASRPGILVTIEFLLFISV